MVFFLRFSGGKDSQALIHIAQLAGVKFKAHFSPTTIDPPEVIRFIRRNYPEVEIIPPKESIYAAAVRHGILPTMRIRWCCADFKEKYGVGKVVCTGIRKAESVKRSKRNEIEVLGHKFSGNIDEFEEYSRNRIAKKLKHLNQDQFADVKETEIRCISGKDEIMLNPIIEWSDSDVWMFLNDVVRVPHCELYDQGITRMDVSAARWHHQRIKGQRLSGGRMSAKNGLRQFRCSLRSRTFSEKRLALMWAATLALSRKHTLIGGCLINLLINGSLKDTNNYPLTFQKNLNN